MGYIISLILIQRVRSGLARVYCSQMYTHYIKYTSWFVVGACLQHYKAAKHYCERNCMHSISALLGDVHMMA